MQQCKETCPRELEGVGQVQLTLRLDSRTPENSQISNSGAQKAWAGCG